MLQYDKKNIALQWQKLQEDKPVDSSVIRPDILTSWKYSKGLGIDARKGLPHRGDGDQLLARSAELVSVAQPFMQMISEIMTGSGLRIDCIDYEGLFLCSFGDSVLLEESKYNGFITGCDVSIDAIGTNAAGLSLSLKKPVQILGPEHYNVNLHNLNCSATPIYTPDSELVGILNILSYDTPQNRQTLGLTTSIAMAIEKQLALARTVTSLKVSNSELNTIMEYLPQGVIALNKSGEVESYNKKSLEMLSIPQKSSVKQRKSRIRNTLESFGFSRKLKQHKQHKEQEYTIPVGSRKKSFVVNIHSIENGERTLVMLEDTGRIMSLSAVQSNRTSYTFSDITGQCAEIRKAKELATMVAATDSSVLLVGESGTGKELFAQAIHASSSRSKSPFVAINCGAIPADIIESELFGYDPGAFTGAREAGKAGRLETASGGTLFLDEVEAMPLGFQVKLLRAFSSGSMVRVGGIHEISLDLRIISASKVDLIEEVNQGRFREDFYYRIATFPIQIPPLCKRGDDIDLLAKQFLQQLSSEYSRPDIQADEDFFATLRSYNWRGNVRELRNIIERAVVVSVEHEQLTSVQLPQSLRTYSVSEKIWQRTKTVLEQIPADNRSLLKIAEDTTIAIVLEEEKYNISRSAKRLGIARSTLYQKIEASTYLLSVVKSDT